MSYEDRKALKGLLAAKDEKSAKAVAPAPPPPRDDGPERDDAARTLQRFCRSVADDGPLLWQAPRLFGCAGAADLLLGTAAGWRRVRGSASLDVRGERLAKATLECRCASRFRRASWLPVACFRSRCVLLPECFLFALPLST